MYTIFLIVCRLLLYWCLYSIFSSLEKYKEMVQYSYWLVINIFQYIFNFVFSRRFYPKRLSAFRLYIFLSVCSLGIEPTTFCAANAMLYHWAFRNSLHLWECAFQVLTADVTSIFEILDFFLFKVVMVVIETLQKKAHFQTCFCECSLASGIIVRSTFSLYDFNIPFTVFFMKRYQLYWAELS